MKYKPGQEILLHYIIAEATESEISGINLYRVDENRPAFLTEEHIDAHIVEIPPIPHEVTITGPLQINYQHLIGAESLIQIPTTIAVCPYCGGRLQASFTAWEEDANGGMKAIEMDLDCETEPPLESGDWEDWTRQHSQMPYVYMLPVHDRVLKWINKRFRFEMPEATQRAVQEAKQAKA